MLAITEIPRGRDLPGYRIATPQGPARAGAVSWLNDNTLLGSSLASAATLLVGALIKTGWIGWLPAATAIPGGLVTLGLAATAASLVGGFLGNKYNQWETSKVAREGIAVEPPSGINRGILKGGLNAFSMVGAAAFLASVVSTLVGGSVAVASGLMIAGPLVGVVAGIYGAWRGSKEEFDRQLLNYEASQRAYRERFPQPALGASRDVERDGFTAYAHQPEQWHPAQARGEGASFAQGVRGPGRQASVAATPSPASVEAAGFAGHVASRIEELRQGHLGIEGVR